MVACTFVFVLVALLVAYFEGDRFAFRPHFGVVAIKGLPVMYHI